jgi:sulfatase modifying factor 1
MKKQLFIWISLCLAAGWACSGSETGQAPELIPAGMQYIPGGSYLKEVEQGYETIEVEGFLLDRYPVTVAEFRAFVQATGYMTEAEGFGDAGVFDLEKQRWILVKGAYWAYPLGKDKAAAEDDHPVTQVSWNDALAYCKWAAKRLPMENEWELCSSQEWQQQYSL